MLRTTDSIANCRAKGNDYEEEAKEKAKAKANLFEEIIGDPIVVPERNPIVDLDLASYGVHVDLHPLLRRP